MAVATTEQLARFINQTEFDGLPADVQHAGVRAFTNWMGCTLGGSTHPATSIALDVATEFSGPATATLIGAGGRLDALSAAYVNCLSSAAHAYDDTHLATVIHPSGPVAATLFALAERGRGMRGADLLTALVVGIEVACHLGVALLSPPARGQLGWYMTGVAGTIGAAAAGARALGLSHEQTCAALGIAGNQASGFRQTHGSMCTSFVPAHAARCGMQAAILAGRGFSSSMQSIEGRNGFAQVFAEQANLASVDERLGKRWEIRDNALKPYPCGIVIHPVIDAALALHARPGFAPEAIQRIDIEVNPLCLTLCDRPEPESDQDGQVSVQHWAAVALLQGKAGLAQGSAECVRDRAVAGLRARVRATPSEHIARDAARVTVTGTDGATCTEVVQHARGSLDRPMSETELQAKFSSQAEPIVGEAKAADLLRHCEGLAALEDVTQLAPLAVPA